MHAPAAALGHKSVQTTSPIWEQKCVKTHLLLPWFVSRPIDEVTRDCYTRWSCCYTLVVFGMRGGTVTLARHRPRRWHSTSFFALCAFQDKSPLTLVSRPSGPITHVLVSRPTGQPTNGARCKHGEPRRVAGHGEHFCMVVELVAAAIVAAAVVLF